MSPRILTVLSGVVVFFHSFARLSVAAPVPFEEAQASLPKSVTVISADLDEDCFHGPDGKGRCAAQTVDGERVLRLEVDEKTENIWDAGLRWPTAEPVAEKDLLLLVFEIRSTVPDREASVRAVFRRSSKPYDHALSETCTAGSSWKEFALVFPSKVDLDVGAGLLIMNIGARAQSLEMRRVRLLNFARKVNRGSLLGVLKRSPPRSSRTVVGRHLDPELLWEMNAFSDLLDMDEPFDAAGTWRHTYAIWTCHGYMHRANKNVGLVTIWRRVSGETGIVTLTVERSLINDTAEIHRTKAEIQCRNDALAAPLAWSLTHTVTHPGSERPDGGLTTTERGSVDDGSVRLILNGRSVNRDSWSLPFTADWCLFDAVQRLSLGAVPSQPFALLEGLSLHKPGARLLDGGRHDVTLSGVPRQLRRIDLIGQGVLPYEFWLDRAGRLVMVITHSRAYILQPDAEQRFKDYADSRVERALRAQARHEGRQGKEP